MIYIEPTVSEAIYIAIGLLSLFGFGLTSGYYLVHKHTQRGKK